MNKSFKRLKDFLLDHPNSFIIIALIRTWLKDEDVNKDSLYQIPNYATIHFKKMIA